MVLCLVCNTSKSFSADSKKSPKTTPICCSCTTLLALSAWLAVSQGHHGGTKLMPQGARKHYTEMHIIISQLVFSSVQSLSCVWLFATPWTAAQQASLSLTSSIELVYGVGEDIKPSHPLSSPFPPDFNLVQQQGLFQWVSSSNQVAKLLELQLQQQPFQWIFRTDFL